MSTAHSECTGSECQGESSIFENFGESSNTSSITNSSASTTCQLCGYESGRASNLKRHMKTMHEVKGSDLYCCDRRFEDKAEYRAHCRALHKNGHECPSCHRLFSRRALLRRHQSVHTGHKDFHCDACPYASSHKSNLERHLKTHSESRRGRRLRSEPATQTQPAPDSTTQPNFPILRQMLGSKSRSLLSHSIESILGRKDSSRKESGSKDPIISSTRAGTSVLGQYRSAEVNRPLSPPAVLRTGTNPPSASTPEFGLNLGLVWTDPRFGSDYGPNPFSPYYHPAYYYRPSSTNYYLPGLSSLSSNGHEGLLGLPHCYLPPTPK